MAVGGFIYNLHSVKPSGRAYWRCHNYSKKQKGERCKARCVVTDDIVVSMSGEPHNHGDHSEKIEKCQQRESFIKPESDA